MTDSLVLAGIALLAFAAGAWALHFGLPRLRDHDAKAIAAMTGEPVDDEGRTP